MAENASVPVEIARANVHDVLIRWKDGHESLYPARALRLVCPCATCVDETTGRRQIDPAAIPQDVHPAEISPVGGYAVAIQWSDGHRTGIYSFTKLRETCPCCQKSRRFT